MSRLDYAPKRKDVDIKDIKKGTGVFVPKSEKPVSFAALKSADLPIAAGGSDLDPALALAPIRVTSPGLTVYKGGAIVPRVFFVKQHLGDLDVSRQILDLSISYTPSPRVQLQVELPVSRLKEVFNFR